MTATISKWGNSQGLRLPKELMRTLHLSTGDKVEITTQDNKIIIERMDRKKYDIRDLVKKIPQDYRTDEVFQDKFGMEEW